MAITDNLFEGESYFVSEIKSLRRMAYADTSKQPLLCAIDEVLRGTNTIERIAASSEFLKFMATKERLCLAATHDIELCTLLDGLYRLFHFEETMTDEGDIQFDYTIKIGSARTRNAIKLMKSLGFDEELIKRANEKANIFLETGIW
jgi:DNA mismatch repair ATPase MutS